MADFICLAMASQYTDNNNETPQQPQSQQAQQQQASGGFRRSLGTSTLFGRRSSRSNTGSNITTGRPTSDSSIIQQQQQEQDQTTPTPQSVHIRIVPSIENPSRSLVFSIIERDLEVGRVIKIGRFTDRSSIQNHISFRSKVCSRAHAEIWLNNEGKVQLKDTRSSSGTFVNHVRLSAANTESRAVEIRDGDLVQLGVDYQGGFEEIYRSVKMRFEVNRPDQQRNRPVSYSMSAFNNLRNLTSLPALEQQQVTNSPLSASPPTNLCHSNENSPAVEVEECCICLYALAPFQALFVAPCSHSYHFKCIRPLFDSYPGFQCPICRTYSDLDASVAIEADEVIEKFGLRKSSTTMSHGGNHQHLLSTTTTHDEQGQEDEEEEEEEDEMEVANTHSSVHPTNVSPSSSQQPSTAAPELPLSTTLVSCSTSLSGILSSPSSSSQNDIASNNERQGSRDFLTNNNAAGGGVGDHRATVLFEGDNVMSNHSQQQQQVIMTTRGTNNLVEKIKMAFSNEKRRRRSTTTTTTTHQSDSMSSGASSDEDLGDPCSSSSSPPSSPRNSHHYLQPILSRQSSQYNALTEIVEEPIMSGGGGH